MYLQAEGWGVGVRAGVRVGGEGESHTCLYLQAERWGLGVRAGVRVGGVGEGWGWGWGVRVRSEGERHTRLPAEQGGG